MRDYNEQIALDNDERIASGSVEVVDYELLVGAKAIGSIDVLSYAELVGVKASGGITITAFASLTGKTVTIGTDVLTEGVGFTAGTSNDATAESLKDAIHALSGFTATRSGAVVTVVSATAGRAGNLIAMSSNAEAGITFSENSRLMGGKNEGTITVGTDVLTQGVGFTAGTSNAVTAESIKDGIHALTGVTATRATDKVNIEMSAVGVAGNIALSATWDNTSASALTLSGATLTGGRDEGTITVGTDVLTQGTDFTSATDDETTAESIKDAIHALSDISATRADETVAVVADSAGLAGNLAISSNSAGVEVSGMSGGLDYFYSEVFSYDNISAPSLETSIEVSGLGVAETVDVVLEVSFNSVEWATRHTYDQFTADGTKTALINKPRSFARLKCSVSAGATATVKFNAQTSQQDYEDGATDLTAIAADIALIEGKITVCNTGAIVGTVTANAGTDLNTSLLALETGGNLASASTSLAIIDDWDDGADSAKVVGNVAHGATDSGSPVKVGAKYNTAPPTLTDGQRSDLQVNASGELKVATDSVSHTLTLSSMAIGALATALSATSSPAKKVIIQNRAGNAVVYVGDSTLTTDGIAIFATGSIELKNVDLANVYINGTTADVVSFLYTN